MKLYTYWENAPGRAMPPYVALSISTMRRSMGERFELLTPEHLSNNAPEVAHKRWEFEPLTFRHTPAHLAIVAKSDYLRLAWVARYGGMWLDADMIVTATLSDLLQAAREDGKLHWSSEAFFTASAGCEILRQAAEAALAAPLQSWGNPGRVMDLIKARPQEVTLIDPRVLDPGCEPRYCFQTCNTMLSKRRSVGSFLTNPDLRVLKLYNTYWSRSELNTSLTSFLESGTLLARIFLSIEPEYTYWLHAASEVMSMAAQTQRAKPG